MLLTCTKKQYFHRLVPFLLGQLLVDLVVDSPLLTLLRRAVASTHT